MEEQDVFGAIGEDGFQRLIRAFYRRVPADSILGPMYPALDLEGAESRLRNFLIFRFGGPPNYIQERGHPRLRMRHAPFAVNSAARDHWLQLMRNALAEANLPSEAEALLWSYFESTAAAMMNRP